MSIADSLALARASIGQPVEALAILLETWRVTHDPEIARLIDEVSAKLPHATFELRRRKPWDEALARRADLLIDLIEALYDDSRVWRTERIVNLCALPADPRVLRALRDLVDIAIEDDRPKIRRRIAELAIEPEPLDEPARAQLAALCAEWDARANEERALLAEVYADPDNDGPRHIYGDWLQQHDDPRGELLATQVRRSTRPRDEGARLTEKKLLDRYGRTWLGALRRGQITVVAYDRGFVSSVAVYRGALPAARGLVEWATVREMTFLDSRAPVGSLYEFLGHDIMRSLRSLGSVSFDELTEVAKLPTMHGLETVRLAAYGKVGDYTGLPNLKHIVTSGQVAWLVGHRLRAQVARLTLDWTYNATPIREILIEPAGLEELTLLGAYELRLVRGEKQLGKLVVSNRRAPSERDLREMLRVIPDRLVEDYEVHTRDAEAVTRIIRDTLKFRR